MADSNKVAQVRDGWLSGSIFENEGSNGTYYSVQFQRGYRQDGAVKYSNSMNQDDLLKLANLATEAHNKIRSLRQKSDQPE